MTNQNEALKLNYHYDIKYLHYDTN